MASTYHRQRLAGGALAALALTSTAFASDKCSIDTIQRYAPAGTTIIAAAPSPEPVAHCRVEGYVTTTDPGPNQVNFRLQLPDKDWAGRYFFIGMGGSAGYVPSDSQVPAGNPLLGGFAVAGTDTGRQGHMLDWDFVGESEAKALDHRDRGAHVTNVAAQQITRSYYDVDTMYRYMSGCSGGGRMSTEAIERHPEDFDGVVLGAPGDWTTILSFVYNAQQMTREPGSWLSPTKLAMLEQKVTAHCDALDGAEDGLIWDERACSYDFDQLKCADGDGADCLTGPEIKSVKAILEGPIGPDGKPIRPGWPISNMSVWSGFLGPVPPPWSPEASMENIAKSSGGYVIASTMANVYMRPGIDVLTEIDLTNQDHLDAWVAGQEKVQFGLPFSGDLRKYQDNGGKLILWNGVSDPCCLDTKMNEYYHKVAENIGSVAKTDEFAKYYRIPGMAHCGGGTGPQDAPDQMIRAMIDWVENGVEPAAIVAHRGADRAKLMFADPATGQVSGVLIPPPQGVPHDFTLCPYPQVPTFDKSMANAEGAVHDAKNWSCRLP
ncbi:MAG: tannase/feruloyl esterase family alpha/beta hydrolase [Porticoccaceae bacterium]